MFPHLLHPGLMGPCSIVFFSFFLFLKYLFIWLHQILAVTGGTFTLCYGMWVFFLF